MSVNDINVQAHRELFCTLWFIADGCSGPWYPYQGHEYWIQYEPHKSYYDAKSTCSACSSKLATITTTNEQDFLMPYMQ